VTEPRRLKFCVDGQWIESKTDKYMPVTDSSTGAVIAEAPACTADEVKAAIQAASNAFPAWADRPVAVRTRCCFASSNWSSSTLRTSRS